jgi:hypothetical protein
VARKLIGQELTFAQPVNSTNGKLKIRRKQMTIEERKAVLDQVIARYSKQGYRVTTRTDISAQMVRPKQFSCLVAVICAALALFPLLIYLFYYMSKKDKTIYISVDESGKVTIK